VTPTIVTGHPVPERRVDSLDVARRDAGLTRDELWIRYFALGGMMPAMELEAMCTGALTAAADDNDHVVHALNERFSELGRNHPLPYFDDVAPP
jgi:hypothetical protein